MIVGIKFIALRTPGGELIPGSGLFVQIKKTAAEMSGRRGQINRQEAVDLKDGTVDSNIKEEIRESSTDGRKTDRENEQTGCQKESSLMSQHFQRAVIAEVHSDTQ